MHRAVVVVVVSILTLGAGGLSAATLTGSFAYDGQPVSSVFPDYDQAQIAVLNQDTSEWTFGTVDLASGTYVATDLVAGNYFVRLLIGPEAFDGRVLLMAEEVTGWGSIVIGSEPEATLDFSLRYGYRITEPFSDDWPGSIVSCPYGPEAPTEFTFSWDPVPRAVSYTARMERWSCDGQLGVDAIETTATSVQFTQGTVPGEEYVSLNVVALSADGLVIAARPNLQYEAGTSEGAYVRMGGGGGSGRQPHPTASVFVPQVARLPGVAPSFWTSDVVLTNTSDTVATARLTYTARGDNGLDDYLEEAVTVPAGGCRVLADVVGETFGAQGAGWLEVSPASFGVTSRISTPGPAGGSYGQGFPALTLDDAVARTGTVTSIATGGVVRGAFRSNLVLTEVWGESATVRVWVFDREGAVLGQRDESLEPFGTAQLNDVVGKVGGPATLEEGQVAVEVVAGDGRVVSVLSLVDQQTGDPTTLVLTPQ